MKNVDWNKIQEETDAFLAKHEIKNPECGFYVGPGWLPIVFASLREMIDAGWNKDLHQVKQKFCTLRIYIGEADQEIYNIIHEAEKKCAVICEICGKRHDQKVPKSGMALCEVCK